VNPLAFASSRELEPGELADAPVHYPRPSRLARALELPGVRATQAARAMGLHTLADLLEHLPRDQRESRPVAELVPGDSATVVVEVRSISSRSVRRRGMRPIVEAVVEDGTGSVKATFFNQPWLAKAYPPGTRLVLHGRCQGRRRFTVQAHARTSEAPIAAVGEDHAGGRDQGAGGDVNVASRGGAPGAVAHYPATQGLTSTQILALVREHSAVLDDVPDALPVRLRMGERLAGRPDALTAAHFPRSRSDAKEARRRLAFDELLLAQLVLRRRRRLRERASSAPVLSVKPSLTARWLAEELPFRLTDDQRRAVEEIDRDLARPKPMQRLLMGEVGSGKTVVALYALLRAVEQGWQGALMAPTETLAEQHFATIQSLLGSHALAMGLLTGSTPARRAGELRARLATGQLVLVVGTHALIEETVRFGRLGVAVVDEQHRFGVAQRAALDRKGALGESPHVLHMTATPIPRTLALAGYGDLEFTMLRQLPEGRQPVRTFICSTQRERARAYERLREELRQGRQAFVVCPLVEESELLQARAATSEFERLRDGELADFRLVLMHGQLRPAAKQAAMSAFAAGDADLLVATSVIEVGIDVPNATVMLVEDADRYGISQLHQLRGRIGRGPYPSLCLLFGPQDSARLRAVAGHTDGFRLAEVDLRLRGEGELAGTRQHGATAFRVAELPGDAPLLERAAAWARTIMDEDPGLEMPEHALLADALGRALGDEAAAPMRA
jgi:ATP-dependent DNA helicase RecG